MFLSKLLNNAFCCKSVHALNLCHPKSSMKDGPSGQGHDADKASIKCTVTVTVTTHYVRLHDFMFVQAQVSCQIHFSSASSASSCKWLSSKETSAESITPSAESVTVFLLGMNKAVSKSAGWCFAIWTTHCIQNVTVQVCPVTKLILITLVGREQDEGNLQDIQNCSHKPIHTKCGWWLSVHSLQTEFLLSKERICICIYRNRIDTFLLLFFSLEKKWSTLLSTNTLILKLIKHLYNGTHCIVAAVCMCALHCSIAA